MSELNQVSFVRTIGERCRVCYTCVRECPAKAIRITGGQSEILPERCICCGNCVKVCSQGAKQIVKALTRVEELLGSGTPVAALVAPSFPADFREIDAGRFVGMLKRLGFAKVLEVAFGADLVADRYRRLVGKNGGYIATSCPALVEYVERYQPDLASRLAPIISPMVATARAARHLYGREMKMVFIGPCIAKKSEAARSQGDVDEVLTFVELREMWKARGIDPEGVDDLPFDEPQAGLGALFPVSRGLLQAAGLNEDLLTANVVVSDGRTNFVEALQDLAAGEMTTDLLEILCCNGCIMGPGMSTDASLYRRRARISRYAQERLKSFDEVRWRRVLQGFDGLDLSRSYEARDQRMARQVNPEAVSEVLLKMGKVKPEDELNCGACGYDTCQKHAIAIVSGLAEVEMCLPYTIEQLRKAIGEVEDSKDKLADAKAALMQAEKLASMGQLAAGIAHEVNNPLGVVLLYSHLLLKETKDAATRQDLMMVVEQADRCKKIVSGLLHFARQNKVVLQPVNVYQLVQHSLKAMKLPDRIQSSVTCSDPNPVAEIDRDQIVQVLTNLVTNAVDAMPGDGQLGVDIRGDRDFVFMTVRDTGIGVPADRLSKIFEPFFTTKQIGKGTGLGLAVTYGIVKMHKGDISVQSNADPGTGPTGSSFTVKLPRRGELD